MIFAHSGNIGDILWSLPFVSEVCKQQRIADYIVKNANFERSNQYDSVKRILLAQPFIRSVASFNPQSEEESKWSVWPGCKLDYDLDAARKQRGRVLKHVYHVQRYFEYFGIAYSKPCVPWITIGDYKYSPKTNYALISLTDRWHGKVHLEKNGDLTPIDWKRIYDSARTQFDEVFFIGFPSEWHKFKADYDNEIDYLFCEDVLDLACVVNSCSVLYCNQGPALVLAQALGKEYHCAWFLERTNCKQHTPNEHTL